MLTEEPETQKQIDLSIKFRNKMSLFENGAVRGHHLELVYQYLLTISPTSVEEERAFSAAGFIANKIRSRLGDDILDALMFLRSYFQRIAYLKKTVTYSKLTFFSLVVPGYLVFFFHIM